MKTPRCHHARMTGKGRTSKLQKQVKARVLENGFTCLEDPEETWSNCICVVFSRTEALYISLRGMVPVSDWHSLIVERSLGPVCWVLSIEGKSAFWEYIF